MHTILFVNSEANTTELPVEVFKAYDIRGLYGEQITGDTAELIGRGFAIVLADLAGKKAADLRVGMGRDMRLTAPEIAGRFKDGLLSEGVEVIDAGMVGTEMLYYLVGSRELDGGAMVTASHNPKQYTGIKLVREGALALSGDSGIQEIKRTIQRGFGPKTSCGSSSSIDIYEEFQAEALSFISPTSKLFDPASRRLKVVVDGGNGMAGPMVGPILEKLNVEVVESYWQPDGNFPDHEPNPLLEENRKAIIERVLSEGADLGIAWDGDADRCFFIDDKGQFVDGDFLTAALAESILQKNPGSDILYDVRASRAVADTVEQAGGKAHINRVGHAFFKGRMREEKAIFGGEVSGHYYFRNFYCADSGTLPALLILERLADLNLRMSDLIDRFRSKYFISGEINSTVSNAESKIAEIKDLFKDAEITELDGVSVDYPDWHFNVRSSNTEPLLRLNLESLVSYADMEKRRDQILSLIRSKD